MLFTRREKGERRARPDLCSTQKFQPSNTSWGLGSPSQKYGCFMYCKQYADTFWKLRVSRELKIYRTKNLKSPICECRDSKHISLLISFPYSLRITKFTCKWILGGGPHWIRNLLLLQWNKCRDCPWRHRQLSQFGVRVASLFIWCSLWRRERSCC